MPKQMIRRQSLWNILRQAAKPYALPVMLEKVSRRFRDKPGLIDARANAQWIDAHVEDAVAWACQRDSALWAESLEFGERLTKRAEALLTHVPFTLSGGGHYVLLYFLTRYLQPSCVVETGVAAGYSSTAFLEAMAENGKGTVYSSDFPAFRLPKPEQYIGLLVPPDLRGHWKLWIKGDKRNLRQIAAEAPVVDLFHYDSDKTYVGRERALRTLKPRLTPVSVLVMDDIQDNSFFHDWVLEQGVRDFWIFEFQGKYLGVAGERLRGSGSRA